MKKSKKTNTLSTSQKNKIFALVNKGLSQRVIAEKVGCNKSTVGYWLNK